VLQEQPKKEEVSSESSSSTVAPQEFQAYHQQIGYQDWIPTSTMAMHPTMQAAAMEQAYQWQLALAYEVGYIDTHIQFYSPPISPPFQRIYQLEAMLQATHSICAVCGGLAGVGGCGMEGAH